MTLLRSTLTFILCATDVKLLVASNAVVCKHTKQRLACLALTHSHPVSNAAVLTAATLSACSQSDEAFALPAGCRACRAEP